ncbi:MAG: hypothetical protein AB7O38_13185 [Pirellulaceae bacterium]
MSRWDRKSPETRTRIGSQPIDYRSRRIRVQLFVLTAALMAVLVGMNEARKPETWRWLWAGDTSVIEEPVDTRVDTGLAAEAESPDESSAESRRSSRSGGTPESAGLTASSRERRNLREATGGPAAAWQEVYTSLNGQQMQTLASMLRAARLARPPEESGRDRWSRLVEELTDRLSVLGDSVSGEAASDATAAVTALEALRAVAAGASLAEAQRQALVQLEEHVHAWDLAAVRDDMVWRPAERGAWFRILERLQHSDTVELARESVGEVSHLQLFRQAAEYRGEVVTIRGRARLGYRVTAPPNELGVRDYAVLWIRPADGANLPIAVYVLATPSGFPPLPLGEPRALDEQVTVVGVFFKRLLYRAHDGLNSVPLAVARGVSWQPEPATAASLPRSRAPQLDAATWFMLGLALVAVAAGIAWLANGSGRSSVVAAQRLDGVTPEILRNLPAVPSVDEALRELGSVRNHGTDGQAVDEVSSPGTPGEGPSRAERQPPTP